MSLMHRNKPEHSLLLQPVRLGDERWPDNKVRLLSSNAEGHLFTQLVGRSTYRRMLQEARQMAPQSYATLYWDSGDGRFTPLLVEVGEKESWALERILEHAVRSAIIPDVLKKYPSQIIRLGELKYQQLMMAKARGKAAAAAPGVLDRLPYYRKADLEVSLPIYKAQHAFPLIILKLLPRQKGTPPGEQPLLVLDNDGDMMVTSLPAQTLSRARKKLGTLRRSGKEGYLIARQQPGGIAVDAMPVSPLQRQALEAVAHYFEENGKGKPLSTAVKEVMDRARKTAISR